MLSVTGYSWLTFIANRVALEVLLEHTLLSCQLREEGFLNLILHGICHFGK